MKPGTAPVPPRNRHGDPVILCVDDEPEILGALRRCFRNEPYEVITAGGTEEALGWLAELPAVDLVLTDERMPNMSGTELLQEVRRRSPQTVRVILTGYPSAALVQKGLEAGAGVFLYKPWDDGALRDTVRRLLLGSRRLQRDPADSPISFDVGGEAG
jgi:response regulator RpfG family c-di-GMP phosphodiesterase